MVDSPCTIAERYGICGVDDWMTMGKGTQTTAVTEKEDILLATGDVARVRMTAGDNPKRSTAVHRVTCVVNHMDQRSPKSLPRLKI